MYIEEGLRTYALADAALSALIGTRWYGPTLEEFTAFPAVTVQCISNTSVESQQGYSGLERARYQLTVHAESQIAALPVVRRLERLFDGVRGVFGTVSVGRSRKAGRNDAGRDPGQKLYRISLDVFIDYTVSEAD